jgi:uncharacterized protein
MYQWDDAKCEANLAKHGADFAAVVEFDWTTANKQVDNRRDYGEVRMVATGRIGQRLYLLIYAERGAVIRIISLRKANKREARKWVSQKI